MKSVYFDCFSGISGDMCLGALVDAGVPLGALKRGLKKLPLGGYRIEGEKVKRSGLAATKVTVKATDGGRRLWKDVRETIGKSTLSPWVRDQGLKVFRALFMAEAEVHGGRYDRVHLHELGAVDALVDVIGTLICLEALGVEKVFSSPVNLGGGTVGTSHGLLPVPAPATAELLKGLRAYSTGVDAELATPTGAAILKALSSASGPMPPMLVEAVGTGAGQRDFNDRPNVLRAFVGDASVEAASGDGVTVIETNIDDMNPEIYGHLMEALFKKGALDAYLTQVIMKKGRPGVKLTVLSPEDRVHELSGVVFSETTTLGLRFWRAERVVLPRAVRTVRTEYGDIRLKEARLGDKALRAVPEYEDCRRAAKKHGVPLLEVMRKAVEG